MREAAAACGVSKKRATQSEVEDFRCSRTWRHYLGRGQRFKRRVGVLLPACEGGFEHKLVIGGNAHQLHKLRHVVHVEHVDDVAAEAVAHNACRVAFERRAFGRHLRQE